MAYTHRKMFKRSTKMAHRSDPEGRRLPIKLDPTSNGEFEPIPLSKHNQLANRLAHDAATENAHKQKIGRRQFLVSACGAASTLLAINTANAAGGRTGGWFDVDKLAAVDPDLAAADLEGGEFIFDIQGHYVDPNGDWVQQGSGMVQGLKNFPNAGCARFAAATGDHRHLQCFGPEEFIKDIFMDSDTDMMVLSFVPSRRESEPLTIEEAAATREIVAAMEGAHRLMLHGRVNPNQDGDMQGMDELAERWDIAAWKTYTQYGPGGVGFYLNDDVGIEFIEKARKLGVKNICIHKGIPFGRRSYEHSLCDDVGIVAKQFPDVNFLIYHSGYIPGQTEGPYDPDRGEGIDSLIKSVIENDVVPNSNVYAELGSTWRMLMQDPDSGAHALGKLFKYIGEDNVVWGSDCIWYGSPQDQIVAFRTFQISDDLREQYNYPKLTSELRTKVFGLNATRPYNVSIDEAKMRAGSDRVSHMRAEYRIDPDPKFRTYGPKTRREFLNLLRLSGATRT